MTRHTARRDSTLAALHDPIQDAGIERRQRIIGIHHKILAGGLVHQLPLTADCE